MNEPLLTVRDLCVELNRHQILNHVNFNVQEKETVAVIGPNGAGKTIFFKSLLGFVPYKGTIIWKRKVKIGYVPQKLYIDADLPLTTKEFFELKTSNEEDMYESLLAVGFAENQPHKNHLTGHILLHKIGVLSGGELQRVLIAWALLGNPDILLFDEPTAGIDVGTEETIYSLLHKLQLQKGFTIILISHELQVVYQYATNVICLNQKQLCFGPPRKVMDKGTLEKLFGGQIGIYEHHREET